jgi:hypothetical protein
MSSLIDKNFVIAVGDIEETPDAYMVNDTVISKTIAPDAVLIEAEPPHASDNGWLYVDGSFVEKEPVPAFIDYEGQEQNRKTRNSLLSGSDWTQLADVPLTEDCKTAFAAYRQELRGVDLLNPVWPVAPAEEWVDKP